MPKEKESKGTVTTLPEQVRTQRLRKITAGRMMGFVATAGNTLGVELPILQGGKVVNGVFFSYEDCLMLRALLDRAVDIMTRDDGVLVPKAAPKKEASE